MKISIKREVLESCLVGSQNTHPKEFHGLLSGVVKSDSIIVETLFVTPLFGSSSFNVGLSLVGTFQSNPTGAAIPLRTGPTYSRTRQGILFVASYPYTVANVHAFDPSGKEINFEIV